MAKTDQQRSRFFTFAPGRFLGSLLWGTPLTGIAG
jgi:hypothetical protein